MGNKWGINGNKWGINGNKWGINRQCMRISVEIKGNISLFVFDRYWIEFIIFLELNVVSSIKSEISSEVSNENFCI